MKAKTIWIIVGVVVLILIIANWNKIFGQAEKKAIGGRVAPGGGAVYGPLTGGSKKCTSSLDCGSAQDKCVNGKCVYGGQG